MKAWPLEVVAELTDDGSFARGVAYASDGRVERVRVSDRSCTATVRGSRLYGVELSESNEAFEWSCECPVGAEGRFCKHCVAVAVVVNGWAAGAATQVGADAIRTYLETLDRAALVDLVVEQTERDDALHGRLSVRASAAARSPVDVREWRTRLRKAFGGGRFIDYHAAPAWEAGVDDTLNEVDDLLDVGYATEVVALVEYAHGRLEKVMQHIDDSDGCVVRLSDRLGRLHLRACAAAAPDPVKLARRLVELELGAELDTFHRAACTYADVLGPTGIDEYRRRVQPHFDVGSSEFRVRNARIGVALAAGAPDELIAVLSDGLLLPDEYTEIAALLAQQGRVDEARNWCEEGLSAFANRPRQLEPLRELLARLHRSHGDAAAAVGVFWAAFEQSPSCDTYRRLVREADASGEGQRVRGAALEVLERSSSLAAPLVEVHLLEGRVDAAWQVAAVHDCGRRLRLELAGARERDHPEDAIPIYEREIEELIDQKKDGAYRAAVTTMAHVESLYERLERPDAFDALLERLHVAHGRKPNLMRRIAAQGW